MKIKLCYILFWLVLLNTSLLGQELLTNGGFEVYIKCPPTEKAGDPYVNGYLVDWYQSLGGRMKHEDCYIGDSDFWYYIDTDSLSAYSGKGITTGLAFGNRVSSIRNTRAYLMAPLNIPMIKDSTYRVSYYIHCNRNYALVDHFGATFVRDTTDLFVEEDSNGLALYTEEYVGYSGTYLGPDDQWHHIEGCYTAQGGELWIALGQFLPFDEVNWHPTYVGKLANGGAAYLVDEVSVTLASQIEEDDRDLIVCDGEYIDLPNPKNENVLIKDTDGNQVDGIIVDWPLDYNFYYKDACFGTLGEIRVETETCYDYNDVEDVICEDERIIFSNILNDNDLEIRNEDNEIITDYQTDIKGTYYFTVVHEKYGEVGQVQLEVVECEDCKLQLPNIIASKSMRNNEFKIETKCSFEEYEIAIYDRWGSPRFRSTDPYETWSPTNQETGVYVIIIKYKFLHPLDIFSDEIMTGTLTVLK